MSYVYILQSQKNGRFYIGSTIDIDRRFQEHQSGKVFSTKPIRPLKMVFYKKYLNLTEARLIEIRLKKLKRRDFLEKIIESGKIYFKDGLGQMAPTLANARSESRPKRS